MTNVLTVESLQITIRELQATIREQAHTVGELKAALHGLPTDAQLRAARAELRTVLRNEQLIAIDTDSITKALILIGGEIPDDAE